jgi:hypothetical protein
MVTDWKYDLQNGVISRSDDRSSDGSTNVTTTVVNHPPCQMSKPRVIHSTETSVCIEFDECVDIDSVTHYLVEYQVQSPALLPSFGNGVKVERNQNQNGESDRNHRITTCQCVINNLMSDQSYDFVVSAVNDAGVSQPSEPTCGKTKKNITTLEGNRETSREGVTGETKEKNNFEIANGDKESCDEDIPESATCCCCISSQWCHKTMINLASTIETEDGEMDSYVSGDVTDTDSARVQLKGKGRVDDWTRIIFHALLSQTGTILTFLLVVLGLCHGVLFSLLLALSWLLYGALQNPRPPISYWNNLLLYIMFWMSAKFVFQSPLFCINASEDSLTTDIKFLYPSIQPYCPEASSDKYANIRGYMKHYKTNWLRLLSPVYKDKGSNMWLWLDIITILALLLHKQQLYVRGLWSSSNASNSGCGGEPSEQVLRRLFHDMNKEGGGG